MAGLRLENRVVIITGAGGGMGSACARTFAKDGALLALFDLHRDRLEEAAAQVSALGQNVLIETVDVCDQVAVNKAVARTVQTFGRVDILVNTAGHQGPGAPVWEVEPEAWRLTLDVNLWGTFLMCRAVLPQMVRLRYGRVINVSSGAGNHPMAFFSGYSASKAGVTHFTRTIAEELKPYGITANAMGVRGVTRMWWDVLDAGSGGGTTTESICAQYEDGMRPDVEENMSVFLFLASDESRHVTGQYLEANSLPDYVLKKQ
jgi:NAD(P)-dependent dehydrogenase (short-subunit alcohol dehydrogenase family)